MQNAYTMQTMVELAQRDRLAQAQAARLARLAARPSSGWGFATALAGMVRTAAGGTPDQRRVSPRLQGSPTAR